MRLIRSSFLLVLLALVGCGSNGQSNLLDGYWVLAQEKSGAAESKPVNDRLVVWSFANGEVREFQNTIPSQANPNIDWSKPVKVRIDGNTLYVTVLDQEVGTSYTLEGDLLTVQLIQNGSSQTPKYQTFKRTAADKAQELVQNSKAGK